MIIGMKSIVIVILPLSPSTTPEVSVSLVLSFVTAVYIADPYVDLDDPVWTDINIVTGCLKLFFRELPDPLIPFKLFRPFIDAASKIMHCTSVVHHNLYCLSVYFVFLLRSFRSEIEV